MARSPMNLVGLYGGLGAHPGGWRMPGAATTADIDFADYARVTATCERGKFDAVVFDDYAGVASGRDATPSGHLEPIELIPALAMLTRHVGLIGTTSTAHGPPYHAARRCATLDHISNGRAGWHLVNGESAEEARNFGRDAGCADAECYARAAEFYEVCAGLWDSWDADAVVRDKRAGRYYDPAKVHVLGHKGQFFSVRGPLNVARCPQGRPFVVQSDTSDQGCALAVQSADVVIASASSPSEVRGLIGRLSRARGHASGAPIKVLQRLVPVIGRTDEEAVTHLDRMNSLAPKDSLAPSATKGLCGSPSTIADTLQRWVEDGGVHGFALAFAYYHAPLDDFVEHVVPELQRRGLFRLDYTATTLRGHLDLGVPQSRYPEAHSA